MERKNYIAVAVRRALVMGALDGPPASRAGACTGKPG